MIAGSDGLGARVRWVHVLELADAAHLLQGGELVLTTGVALPAEPALLARYAEVSGRQVDDIDYYLILAKWKFAVVLEQGFQRAGDDVKLQAFGPVVLELMRGAADLAESTEYRS